MNELHDSSDCRRISRFRWAMGLPYATVMRLRRWAYRKGLFGSSAAGVPVICVGNLTCGGTGKTPMVAWVVRQLQEMGRTPAILTRGYKAVDGKADEAELLKNLTGAAVVVDPNRVRGAKTAVAGGADVLVMDDGFQHRRLRRDLDIILIDATDPFGGGACLPLGLLRESLSAMRDAGAIVITRSNVPPEQLDSIRRRLVAHSRAPIYTAVHKPVAIIEADGTEKPAGSLSGRTVFLFCGLGNPLGFLEQAVGLGAKVVGSQAMSDHVDYTDSLVEQLNEAADKCEAEFFLTTQKDGVKLGDKDFSRPVLQLAVEMDITGGRAELLEQIKQLLA
ncbi:MAG: tetraacyldisaccharide 4'-kinase [Actinomycetia bacterium]|nr:tetraacyldisaccharide 4'-kinase [Actinomycetes bacterium]